MDSNPYNINNFLINKNQVIDLLKQSGINHIPENIYLYQKSFIHESYRKLKCYESMKNEINALDLQLESYERLEFIGDALIESIVSNYLYSRYHETYDQDEGFLSKLKMRIVCGKNLSHLSGLLGFQNYIVISKSIEEKYNSRKNMLNHKILCDVFESFCGALYKDTNDYEIVKEFIINSIESNLDLSEFIINDNNYKDQLSRYVKKTFDTYPEYIVKDNGVMFTTIIKNKDEIICKFNDVDKKLSQQNAAKEALKYYGILS
tara:strand:+ start:3254 stop:4039 length:786 start_codon:yes stop_codon:yes gene_type:complete